VSPRFRAGIKTHTLLPTLRSFLYSKYVIFSVWNMFTYIIPNTYVNDRTTGCRTNNVYLYRYWRYYIFMTRIFLTLSIWLRHTIILLIIQRYLSPNFLVFIESVWAYIKEAKLNSYIYFRMELLFTTFVNLKSILKTLLHF
jgi:hypothetical protein